MARQYDDLQMLRSLVEVTGVDPEECNGDQVVLDLISQFLYTRAPSDTAYQEVYDIIAKNYSPIETLWDFE